MSDDAFKFDETTEKKVNTTNSFEVSPPVMRKIRKMTLEEALALGVDINVIRKEG